MLDEQSVLASELNASRIILLTMALNANTREDSDYYIEVVINNLNCDTTEASLRKMKGEFSYEDF